MVKKFLSNFLTISCKPNVFSPLNRRARAFSVYDLDDSFILVIWLRQSFGLGSECRFVISCDNISVSRSLSGQSSLGRKVALERISAVVITKNEERSIGRALASVAWADDVVVLDSGSSDSTVEVARRAGARVEASEWRGYVAAKNAAAELATGEWILSLDADEEVTPELRDEVSAILSHPGGAVGYKVPRRNFFWGRWIRHCGWHPDYQLRLWRRGKGRWVGGRVHERVEVDGGVGRTKAPLNHYTYSSISEYLQRMDRYAGLSAMDKYEAGKRTGFLRLLFSAPGQFIRLYFFRGGFLDGIPGLIVSALGAYYTFLKRAKLWELQSTDRVEEL